MPTNNKKSQINNDNDLEEKRNELKNELIKFFSCYVPLEGKDLPTGVQEFRGREMLHGGSLANNKSFLYMDDAPSEWADLVIAIKKRRNVSFVSNRDPLIQLAYELVWNLAEGKGKNYDYDLLIKRYQFLTNAFTNKKTITAELNKSELGKRAIKQYNENLMLILVNKQCKENYSISKKLSSYNLSSDLDMSSAIEIAQKKREVLKQSRKQICSIKKSGQPTQVKLVTIDACEKVMDAIHRSRPQDSAEDVLYSVNRDKFPSHLISNKSGLYCDNIKDGTRIKMPENPSIFHILTLHQTRLNSWSSFFSFHTSNTRHWWKKLLKDYTAPINNEAHFLVEKSHKRS